MRYFIVLLALLLTSCSSGLPSIKPYRMDIQQGNAITSKMMLQLRPGMTKSQVRFILGTPLIQDSFHIDRWDYFYQMRHDGKIIEQRRVILEFEKEALTRVRGDVVASGKQDALGTVAEPTPVAQPEQKKSWVDHLKFWEDDKKPQAIYVEKPTTGSTSSPQQAPADLVNPIVATPATVAVPEVKEKPETEKPLPQIDEALKPVAQPAEMPNQPVLPKTTPPVKKQAPPIGQKIEIVPLNPPAPEAAKLPAPAPVQPVVVAQPAATPPSMVTPAKKPVATPKVEQELPPEGAPGYFERLLEKIGF